MLFPVKKRYLWLFICLLLGTFVLFAHGVYADKSDLTTEQDAYDAPVDLSGQSDVAGPAGELEYDMFGDQESLQSPSVIEPPPPVMEETVIESEDGSSVKSLKERWEDANRIRDADEEYGFDRYENDIVVRSASGNDYYFSIELAIDPKTQQRGLMFRKSMPKMHGMLFVFGNSAQRSFWMKNTLIPLDIIFIEKDGRIGHIHHNAQPLDETFISSQGAAYAVLELNGGMSHELGINVGDKILHTAFKNRHME